MRNFLGVPLFLSLVAWSFSAHAFSTAVPAQGLPSASTYSGTLLPELQGVVSWKILGQVESVNRNGKMVPSFSDQILALDNRTIRVYGFMMPLDMTEKQKHFLLSAVPPSCPFCLPAGPEALVEVMSKRPVKYGFEPIIMAGTLTLLKDDRGGMLYRIVDAEPIETRIK